MKNNLIAKFKESLFAVLPITAIVLLISFTIVPISNNLILQFAIRDMLTAYLNTSANILVLDEITDFLDKQSCKAIMKLIEKELSTVESVFVVSHHAAELALSVDSELKIIKNEDGMSEVI